VTSYKPRRDEYSHDIPNPLLEGIDRMDKHEQITSSRLAREDEVYAKDDEKNAYVGDEKVTTGPALLNDVPAGEEVEVKK
jgi:hypothetical protein